MQANDLVRFKDGTDPTIYKVVEMRGPRVLVEPLAQNLTYKSQHTYAVDDMEVIPSIEQIATRFGSTPDRVRAQFIKNAVELATMANKAHATGKKVNGYTADELDQKASYALQRSIHA